MSYVRNVLQPGETIIYATTLSWTVYLNAVLLGLAAIVVLVVGTNAPPGGQWFAVLLAAALAIIACISLLHAWFRRWTTEIAVTDRRVILKRGFIRRRSVEMHMEKVESVDVDQTILGRLFNYGTVTVRGTGSTLEPLRLIDRPLQFRSAITAG